MTQCDQYAVFGNPVAHSLSPRIHGWFAEATGAALSYSAIEAPIDGFEASVRTFFAGGGCGANVTVPFKEAAFALADSVQGGAQRARAANTLRREADGSVTAFNTDGIGLVRDLQVNLDVDLVGRRLVLLGAGGAAAGVIEPLLQAGVRELLIGNRTAARATALARRFADLGPVRACALTELPRADVVINATAASLAGAVPQLGPNTIGADSLAYDMMYATEPTPFLRYCAGSDARLADGLGMLVEQAAESFFIWRDVRPDTAAILARLRPDPLFPEHS